MSCQINVTANIADVPAIRRCLFPTDDSRGSDSWLQLCELSVSPTGDVIALANDRRLVILTSKWDTSSSLSQFQITYSGSVHESDNIKSVICVPVVSQTKSSHIVPDWTCILLGFESGFVRFYTENCELLLEEQLHNEVITSIKCRSQHNPRPDIAPDLHPEEIYVQYQSTVCVISGNQLFPILRSCRSDLAKVQAKGDSLELTQGNLAPKKWGFQDQATINDIAVVGVNLHGTFDHLLTASTCGGFDTKYRSQAPYNNLVLAAGSRPFVGFHYALEGCPQPVFSDVAKAVATKIKSALPGWLTGNKASVDKQMTVAMQPAESMGCRFGLCDLRRISTNIVLSPDHKLAAVSDALGRVILMDAFRGVTLRIFKGYREAQCSFIQVPDERHSKHRIGNKVALFLVIYSSKKGTVEIFTVQQGQKICTFSASKFSRLVYNNYGLMGFTITSKSRFVCQFDTVLIDNDGQIKEVLIPFHFALSEKNNKRARDIHLFKKLRQLLKHSDCDRETLESETLKISAEIKTVELKLQTLELLQSDNNLPAEIILKCVQLFIDSSEPEADNLRIVAENTRVLLNFYLFVKHQGVQESGENPTRINLETKQLGNLQKLLDLSTLKEHKPGARVAFQQPELSPSEFLSAFDLSNSMGLRPGIDLFRVSDLVFGKYLQSPDFDGLLEQLQSCRIPPLDLFHLLVYFWVNRPLVTELETEMNNLFLLVEILVKSAKHEECFLWGKVREFLADSAKPFRALTAAIVCKLVSGQMEASPDDESLEILSQESIEWTLLIGKLEDVSLLNIVLANQPVASFATLPKLKHDHIEISLKYILERGKGSVSELVARWLTFSGVDPENIVVNDLLLRKSQDNNSNSSSDNDDDDELPEQDIMPHKIDQVQSEPVFERLNLLKSQFPYSLEAGILLTNMCWEYALAWQKNIEDLGNLEACIKCLTHVTNPHIREGVFNLVWNTHLKIIFESASKLINKVGKLPKERLCKQDTGLSDYQVAIFLGITTNFLDSYMAAVQESHGSLKPILNFEPIWENGPQPLVELALQQNAINYDLLHLHYQLSLTLQMITAFSIKHSKPLNNLFESYMIGMFFTDFQTKAQINWSYTDPRVQLSRTQFLFKVISASLESVTINESKIYAADHIRWMAKCLEIAKLWNLDLDALRRFELVQIYTNGLDSFGDEVFRGIEEKRKLGPELLAIAGKRLSQFLTTSPNLCQNVTALSTVVTRYMDQLNGDWCAPSGLDGIENLANRSLSCLDETQHEYKIAELLLDGCKTLQSIYKSN
ncbi:rab3 GTPase-activating protein non-catalytic subunit [Tribolium castaneum]|uniref:Rab3 GTPase-activating protein regulatory subunit-like Protein n=1 Tax=Tribolium castaneum TaxID=7070 RepID=D6X347_TRICA|nr:PREDICTED: rab3 GTPase-activating protein non-catalytic subunit [Tribolium castaneum]EFA10326.1 Rab3 GTPase-activating protein regulatory subunit-like Protein [Tribolium castaneum]|eukprot:XP_008197991.1 PREDICTED: rab3 GTPase-activating protein non-catalytic subunit [Tribolium castaneum]